MARIGASGTGGASTGLPNYIYAYGFIWLDNVPFGQTFFIGPNQQSLAINTFTLYGDMIVEGTFLIL